VDHHPWIKFEQTAIKINTNVGYGPKVVASNVYHIPLVR